VVASRCAWGVSAIAVVSILGYVVRTEAQGDALQNIALGRPYRCSVPVLPGWHGLVDGKCDGDSAPECFATSNVDKFPQYVVIDLGAICEISRVVVYNSANGNTRKVSLECSDDASDYQVLRQGFIFPDKSAMVLSHKFTPRKARYVRLTLLGRGPGRRQLPVSARGGGLRQADRPAARIRGGPAGTVQGPGDDG